MSVRQIGVFEEKLFMNAPLDKHPAAEENVQAFRFPSDFIERSTDPSIAISDGTKPAHLFSFPIGKSTEMLYVLVQDEPEYHTVDADTVGGKAQLPSHRIKTLVHENSYQKLRAAKKLALIEDTRQAAFLALSGAKEHEVLEPQVGPSSTLPTIEEEDHCL